MHDVHTTCQFVSKKMRKICWQKSSQISACAPEIFCTGSWDDSPDNQVSLWGVQSSDDDVKFVKRSSFLCSDDVEDLQFITEENVLFSSGKGDLVLLQFCSLKSQLNQVEAWNQLHSGACSSFSVLGPEVVTAGENGRLRRLNMEHKNVSEITGEVSSAPFYCVTHYGVQEVAAGNAVGQLQVWDLRSKPNENLTNTLIPGGLSSGSATSVCCHPSQHHMAVVGYQSGAVVFWDLRRSDLPASALNVHTGPVWEIKFHEYYPTNFFSASNDGSLIHWDASGVQQIANVSTGTSWFLIDSLQNKLKLINVLSDNVFPVNSVDVCGDNVLTCTDNEAIWLLKNLKIC